ncbi:MAG: B12-binding domain-containing radical SAM protein [Desulfohalobiaceae bacterium]
MRILFIYPSYPDTFWSFKHALKFISKKAAFPPLGLLTVASMLPANWEKRLIDLNVEQLKDNDILWADMIFISAMLVQKESAQEVISRCKSLDRKVVAGGPAFGAQPESFPGVDHFVLDEAESTLPVFLRDLEAGALQQTYTSQERPDITQTPLPMWSLIDMHNYATMPVQYSRGCPFDCEFCDIVILNGRKPRTKAPEQMVQEMQALYDQGWKGSVFIVDDNFIGNKKNVKRMLPDLISWQKRNNYPYTLLTEASVNLAEDQELMDLMSAANFNKVFLGLETPCMESLQECGKTQNTGMDLVEAVRTIHQHGMQVMAGFIVGFDNDTESIFETQIKFIQQIGVVTAMVGLLGAIPHTRLWHRLRAEGRLLNETSGDNTDGSLNFIPNMGQDKLLAGYQQVISTIYSPKVYYQRIYTFIQNYQPKAKGKFSRDELRALLKSVLCIGLFSKNCLRYWRLIFKTARTKISALPEAIELTIYGYHFERVAKACQKRLHNCASDFTPAKRKGQYL